MFAVTPAQIGAVPTCFREDGWTSRAFFLGSSGKQEKLLRGSASLYVPNGHDFDRIDVDRSEVLQDDVAGSRTHLLVKLLV